MHKLRHLISLSPRETWRLLRRRLPMLRDGPAWTVADLMSSSKHRHGIRFAEFLLRQEAAVQRHMQWEPLDFEGQNVVEIGCGPLGGYGPLAIFCGARSFESAEPEWDAELFSDAEIVSQYLYILHADLTAVFGNRMDFESFQAAISERLKVHKTGFEDAPIHDKADVVLSQSCLEHVFPLDTTIEKLAKVQHSKTRFLHLVDFGNHYLTTNPFEGLYEQPPDDYLATRGKAINLLRCTDVASSFERAGINASLIKTRRVSETYTGNIHSWWRERYDDDALFTQLALVVSSSE